MDPLELAKHAHAQLADLVKSQPVATRQAHYVTLTALAIDELVEGVLAEVQASRLQNAARLTRHAWEFEMELTWVMAEPETRIDRWRNNEARRSHLLSDPKSPAPVDDWFAQMLAADYERARNVPNSFLPSVQQMARDLGREVWYRDEYRALSCVSHPGLRGTAVYSAATDADKERARRGEAVLGDVPVGRQPPESWRIEMVALQVVLVVARTLATAGPALRVSVMEQVRSIMEPFAQIASENDTVIFTPPPA